MAKLHMRDVIILLPGITGSVLQKDGKDLWAISSQALWNTASSFGQALQQLKLEGDDPDVDDLGDGIKATRLMTDAHIVPGLVKIDGYTSVSRLIIENFDVIKGDIADKAPANFFEFPYDWRRDNRVSARLLKNLVTEHLPRWQSYSGASDAKVILIAHSMGGIVARWYLELLEGWKKCRALITFGTPYRGSTNALNYLSNGYKNIFVDLTDVMRSFTSTYQLLPIYKMTRTGWEYKRVAEIDNIPNVDKERATQALTFHREIESTVVKNQQNSPYKDHGYKIMPIVGTKQPTFQSAELFNDRLTVSRQLPPGIDKLLDDGDGTVPYLSAIPIELSKEFRDTAYSERHSSLQTNVRILEEILWRLKRTQIQGLDAIRELKQKTESPDSPALRMHIEDAYLKDEPIHLKVEMVNSRVNFKSVKANIRSSAGETVEIELYKYGEGWTATIEGLDPGLYRLEVKTDRADSFLPYPVHDIFEVVG